MLDTSSRGTSTRIQSIDSSQLDLVTGPVDHDQPRQRQHLVDALPGADPRRRVVADDGVQHRVRVLGGQSGEGVGGVRLAAGRDLVIAGLEPGDIGHSRAAPSRGGRPPG